ncbi:hypothetical protein EB118_26500 [bacterium]|nr:hypothetical protein [bacterium]NDD83479.1 hypothetical protein [bacterium]NDG33594.1 hypothetical protein [bacterium]
MSYSYLKNVFPNYSTSVEYDDYIFRSLNAIDTAEAQARNLQDPKNIVTNRVIPNYSRVKESNEPVVPANNMQSLSQFTQALLNTQVDTSVHQPEKPIDPVLLPQKRIIEEFSDSGIQDVSCDKHMKHILNCQKCKGVVIKQWDLDADKTRNEEIMEVICYIIFAIFLLLLLETK